ncbi:hypothetical protein ERO13_D06G132550v2 [Gossypium hirsutum]|nr:hypothetical protein ERO13_D06G132550v2 [Gossypium hirsutum]
MLNYCVKQKEINLYVKHEIDTVIFADDDLLLVVVIVEGFCGGNKCVEGLNGEGVKVVGSKGDEGLNKEGVEVVGNKSGEVEGGEDDGDGDKELQEARQKLREVEGKTTGKDKETIVDETESERFGEQFEAEVLEEVEGEGLNDRVGREEEGNETQYFDSDDHSSILGSDDDNDPDACRRRSRFPTNNPNSVSPLFCIWMLFKDGVQFKSAIRKYSMCCRRKLKIIKNEPNRRIFASYNNISRCMQVKIFNDEHNCCVRFRNKMVNGKVILEHFEATIRDHKKMKLREIQRRVASKMHMNVNMIRCRKAKKMVKDKLAGNFIDGFAML